MKKLYFFLAIGIGMLFSGCSGNTYSALRAQEDALIGDFIARNQWHIIYSLPEDDEWGEKDYYKIQTSIFGTNYDDLYFHLSKPGDAEKEVTYGDIIVARYKKFRLEAGADTLSYWTTIDKVDPYEFTYGQLSGMGKICDSKGWHEAVKLMKYPGAECEILVPSKQGFSDDEMSVTPYVYIIKIVNVK